MVPMAGFELVGDGNRPVKNWPVKFRPITVCNQDMMSRLTNFEINNRPVKYWAYFAGGEGTCRQ